MEIWQSVVFNLKGTHIQRHVYLFSIIEINKDLLNRMNKSLAKMRNN